jgi:hypothetical protein
MKIARNRKRVSMKERIERLGQSEKQDKHF